MANKKTFKNQKDFQKQKHKVGKLKPGAVNATDTTIKSKKLNIREQLVEDITQGSSDPLRTKIQTLVVKSRHYSPTMRKESYTGLIKLLKDLKEEELSRMIQVVNDSITKGFIDEDESVRQLFLSLVNLILKQSRETVLSPFFTGWIQFCILSLTHIEPMIRRDGLIFISMTLEAKPNLLLPLIVKLVSTLVPNLSPKSSRPLKKGFKSEAELILQLLSLYTAAATEKPDNMVFDYSWKEVQNQTLRIVRKSPKTSGVDPIEVSVLIQIIEKVLISLSDAWLEMSEFVNTNATSKNPSYRLVLDSIKCLQSLCKCSAMDEQFFWTTVPKALLNVLGRGGKQRLIDHLAL